MLDAYLHAAGMREEPAVVIARASRLNAPLDPWRPCLLLLDGPIAPTALRGYPRNHPVQLVFDTGDTWRAVDATPESLDDPPPEALAAAFPAVPLHDVRDHTEGLRGVIARLRNPDGGCPWDNAQTHESLRPHLLEEAYETLDAIAAGDPAALCEELGDLLMQVVLHARLAEQQGSFDLGDVSEGIRAKLIRRHPHIFTDAEVGVDSAFAMEQVWEQLKARERPTRESVLDGIPREMPALARAQSVLGRAARNGLPRETSRDAANTPIGERILDLVEAARDAELSAEDETRDALDAFEARVRAFEASLREEGRQLDGLGSEELAMRWSGGD